MTNLLLHLLSKSVHVYCSHVIWDAPFSTNPMHIQEVFSIEIQHTRSYHSYSYLLERTANADFLTSKRICFGFIKHTNWKAGNPAFPHVPDIAVSTKEQGKPKVVFYILWDRPTRRGLSSQRLHWGRQMALRHLMTQHELPHTHLVGQSEAGL